MFSKNGFIIAPFLVASCLLTLSCIFGWLIIPNSNQLYGKAVHRVKVTEKIVALTFDDGPNPPYTEQILEVLKKHNVKATFFIVGMRAKKYPHSFQNIIKLGHEIGNHTWSHHVLIGRSSNFIRNEIDSTDSLIRELGYTGTIYFRAPKGMKFIRLPKILAEKKQIHIIFDVVGWDWRCPGVKNIVKNVMHNTRPGSIILLHDGDGDYNEAIVDRSQTVKACDIIIQSLKSKGYRFVTITELLNYM